MLGPEGPGFKTQHSHPSAQLPQKGNGENMPSLSGCEEVCQFGTLRSRHQDRISCARDYWAVGGKGEKRLAEASDCSADPPCGGDQEGREVGWVRKNLSLCAALRQFQ